MNLKYIVNEHVREIFKLKCWKLPGHYLCTPEPAAAGRLGCVISIQKGVKSDVYPVAVSQKVTKNLPVSFYSPTPRFKLKHSGIYRAVNPTIMGPL